MEKIVTYHFSKTSFWIRVYGRGFLISNEPMLFSMRNGYKKYLKLPFGWRISYLKKVKLDNNPLNKWVYNPKEFRK